MIGIEWILFKKQIVIEFWLFWVLGQRGTDKDAILAFERTDIDNSGYIDWNEFLFSILGDDAGDYGLVADLDTVMKLVTEVSRSYDDLLIKSEMFTKLDRNMGRFKNEMGDNLKLCLRQIMQMNNNDPDSISLGRPRATIPHWWIPNRQQARRRSIYF